MVNLTEALPSTDTQANYAVSFDNRVTYKIYDTTAAAWRQIARDNTGAWEYNSAVSGATSWTVCTVNSKEACLSQAMSNTANQMTGTQFKAISDDTWEASGGWSTDINTIDLALGIQREVSVGANKEI